MVRHVVMFRWKDGTTPQQVAAVAEGLGRMPGLIPELVSYHLGTDLGLAPTNFDFAVVAELQSADGFLAYRDHPEHQAVIRDVILPLVAERVAVQFEC